MPLVLREAEAHEVNKVSSTYQPIYSKTIFLVLICILGAESTPGQQCGWKDYVSEKSQ